MEHLESGHLVQSLSQKALSWQVEEERKKVPWPGAFLGYLKTRYAASMAKWDWRGLSMNWFKICTEYARSGLVIVR
jgi:hypothetical protein